MTCNPPMFDSVEISSSVIPSARYWSRGSELKFTIGSTATCVASPSTAGALEAALRRQINTADAPTAASARPATTTRGSQRLGAIG